MTRQVKCTMPLTEYSRGIIIEILDIQYIHDCMQATLEMDDEMTPEQEIQLMNHSEIYRNAYSVAYDELLRLCGQDAIEAFELVDLIRSSLTEEWRQDISARVDRIYDEIFSEEADEE